MEEEPNPSAKHKPAMLGFLRRHCREDVLDVFSRSDCSKHYGVKICHQTLVNYAPELAIYFLEHFDEVTAVFNEALKEDELLKERRQSEVSASASSPLSRKAFCSIRLFNLIPVPEYSKNLISQIRTSDLGKYIQIEGTIVRIGMTKVMERKRVYFCPKCKRTCESSISFECGESIIPPVRPSAAHFSPQKQCCRSPLTTIEALSSPVDRSPQEGVQISDYQEVIIQESIQHLAIGTIPRFIQAILQDDLVDSCNAGDDVILCGVLYNRWKPVFPGGHCFLNMILRAGSVVQKNNKKSLMSQSEDFALQFRDFWKSHEANPMSARDLIVNSFSPNIYGYYWVKLSLLLSLIGGVGTPLQNGEYGRGDIHVLMIGDPGTAKSEFLHFSAKCILRSVQTTGVGTTSAGLTCSAVKESGQWMLEAGALVLADRGLCCIDEFDKIKSQDQTTMHEAMEQQTISVAKAGLVTVLHTRCTILAAMNPLSTKPFSKDLDEITTIGSALLSRFDLILLLPDLHSPKFDESVCSHLLAQNQAVSASLSWNLSKLQTYIIHVKGMRPILTNDAEAILLRYYEILRREGQKAKITTRLIESLVRLSQAHARLMHRTVITIVDAITTVALMELSSGSLFGYSLMEPSPRNPELTYKILEKDVLFKLGIEYLNRNAPPPSNIPYTSFSPGTSSGAVTVQFTASTSTSTKVTPVKDALPPSDSHPLSSGASPACPPAVSALLTAAPSKGMTVNDMIQFLSSSSSVSAPAPRPPAVPVPAATSALPPLPSFTVSPPSPPNPLSDLFLSQHIDTPTKQLFSHSSSVSPPSPPSVEPHQLSQEALPSTSLPAAPAQEDGRGALEELEGACHWRGDYLSPQSQGVSVPPATLCQQSAVLLQMKEREDYAKQFSLSLLVIRRPSHLQEAKKRDHSTPDDRCAKARRTDESPAPAAPWESLDDLMTTIFEDGP